MLKLIKRHLEQYKYYRAAREIKWCLEQKLKEYKQRDREVVSLHPAGGSSKGNVLISYITDGFLSGKDQRVSKTHTNIWETVQIAKTFLQLGYFVDVISYLNQSFIPQKDYTVFIDSRHNMERLTPYLKTSCLKIAHLDTAHILFHNAAEAQRLLAIQQRRGVTLRPRRFEIPNLCIEYADFAISHGNKFTKSTFEYAKKLIYQIPIPASVILLWPKEKDFNRVRKNFLFFSSEGLVHKGLDLVLEAFAEMPEYHLTVCCPIGREKDFEQAYHKEMFETENIETIGWVDVDSSKFLEIIRNCLAVILPSCSEGASVSSVNCIHAGLIPILSYECGVDIEEFGIVLKKSSIEEIRESVKGLADQPVHSLTRMSRDAWEFARENHTQEQYIKKYPEIIRKIISSHGKN